MTGKPAGSRCRFILFATLLLPAVASAGKKNWVQRVSWTDTEIVQAFMRSSFNTGLPLTNEQVVTWYRATQTGPFASRIHMGHIDPHFALRFNAELHGINPKRASRRMIPTPHGRVGAQTFVNRAYTAGAGVRNGNVVWELAQGNVTTGALSGGGRIVNNPTAMGALGQTAARYPNTRTNAVGPYMRRIDRALASGDKVAIRFTEKGFELIPRELPGIRWPQMELGPGRSKLFVETGIRTTLPNTGWRSSLPPPGPNLSKMKLPPV